MSSISMSASLSQLRVVSDGSVGAVAGGGPIPAATPVSACCASPKNQKGG